MRLYRFALVFSALAWGQALAQPPRPPAAQKVQGPWMDKTLSPDRRADMVIAQMTLGEKIQLVHGTGWGALRPGAPIPPGSNEGAGFVPGIERLGIPAINMADSAVGVRMAAVESRYATLLPSTLGAAASFDPEAAYLYGSVIGRELRDQGFNMSIGGGVDLIREPRNGRNFEYAGEDPILAGTMAGQLMKGLQAQQVMGDIKHYAINDQETGRNILNVILDKRAMRETDLLAFQIAVKIAQPAGVMCAYNKVDGDYSCENDYLLNQVLKKEWGFEGWVLSDWGGTHSTTKAAMNGLDQEMPGDRFFGAPLEKAVDSREVPEARLNDMVHRILRSMFACGVIDNPPVRSVVDPFQGLEDARHIAEESIVLLKNDADRIACRRWRTLRRRLGAGGPARRRSGHPPEGRLALDAAGLVSLFAYEIHPRQGATGNRAVRRRRRPGCRGQAGEGIPSGHCVRQPIHERGPGRGYALPAG
jgi:beta-glucosidase